MLEMPRLSTIPSVDYGHDEWRAWEARLDRQRAATYGPPHPDRIRTARRLAEQERALFGEVRSHVLR
jgi:hypothetical protein